MNEDKHRGKLRNGRKSETSAGTCWDQINKDQWWLLTCPSVSQRRHWRKSQASLQLNFLATANMSETCVE